jgi:hypothetical protein
MKKKIEEIAKRTIDDLEQKKITRLQAIKKTGLIAMSAATMMILLSNPAKAQSASPSPPPAF